MTASSFEHESPQQVLLGLVLRNANTFCLYIERYVQQKQEYDLQAMKSTSRCLRHASCFCLNRRLQIFCTELERSCTVLSKNFVRLSVALQILMRAGLLLSASVNNATQGVQEHYLSAATLNAMRALRDAKKILPNISADAGQCPSSLEFLACISRQLVRHLSQKSEVPLASGVMSLESSRLDENDYFGCLQKFADESLLRCLSHKNKMLDVLIIEMLSASPDSFKNKEATANKQIQAKQVFYEIAQRALMRLLQVRIAKRLFPRAFNEQQSLHVKSSCLAEAFLAMGFIAHNDAVIAVKHSTNVARVFLRHLQCWGVKSAQAQSLLLLSLLTILQYCRDYCEKKNPKSSYVVTPQSLYKRVNQSIRGVHNKAQKSCVAMRQYERELHSIYKSEIREIAINLRHFAQAEKRNQQTLHIHTNTYWSICRLAASAFYVQDYTLYEFASSLQSYCALTIENKIKASVELVVLLEDLVDLACIESKDKRAECERVFIKRLSQIEPCLLQSQQESHLASSGKLAIFLSENIRELIIYPEKLKQARPNAGILVIEHQRCILELNMLRDGARALNVERVAALSEALEQVHSALRALPESIGSIDLQTLLCPAHQLLRESLNSAAARQDIQDVQGVLTTLYSFLERGLPVVATKWRRRGLQQRSRQLVAQVDSNLGTMEALSQTPAWHRIGRQHPLFLQLLQEQRSLVQQMQEELSESEHVRFVRVRTRLQRFVARQANASNKLVRLHIDNEALQFRRVTIAGVIVPLQDLVKIIIACAVEDSAVRRARMKSTAARLHLSVSTYKAGISLELSDDGQEIDTALLEKVAQQIHAMGGELRHEYLPLKGNRLRVRLAQ